MCSPRGGSYPPYEYSSSTYLQLRSLRRFLSAILVIMLREMSSGRCPSLITPQNEVMMSCFVVPSLGKAKCGHLRMRSRRQEDVSRVVGALGCAFVFTQATNNTNFSGFLSWRFLGGEDDANRTEVRLISLNYFVRWGENPSDYSSVSNYYCWNYSGMRFWLPLISLHKVKQGKCVVGGLECWVHINLTVPPWKKMIYSERECGMDSALGMHERRPGWKSYTTVQSKFKPPISLLNAFIS